MPSAPDPVLDQIWAKLQPLFLGKRDQFFAAMAHHGLTPPHGQTLTMLAAGPLRMRDIADLMVCDASYVTAIVDNLEDRGLAERRPSSTDRRVKEIALTPKGARAAADISQHMTAPPPALEQLAPADRKALARILAKLDLDETKTIWPKQVRRDNQR
ncbi:MAG: MarR family transcriptional regulator [Ilumatobacteraceae bacterium]|nr:MarR family transcriptional regulator [Ilumatobacteraceae bacterium]